MNEHDAAPPAGRDLPGERTGDARSLYLDLMKRVLLNLIYIEQEQKLGRFDGRSRIEGREWPAAAHTMIGWRRLENVEHCVRDILARGTPGDLIETGVWRGGAIIFMRAILKAYGVTDRCVWGADSFRGLPPPGPRPVPGRRGRRAAHVPGARRLARRSAREL